MSSAFIMFFGPPGCGKGTQAKRVTEEFGLAQISTGELFRKHLGEKTPLGLQAQEFMSRGALVPDSITIGMVRERLQEADAKAGAIFDGFPRTQAQAEALDALLAEMGEKLCMIIDFSVPLEISRDRLLARQEGRADDKPEVIEKRLNDHAAIEDAVMPHYRAQQGLVRAVDATRSIEAIYEDVRSLVKSCVD
ncbi:adenylate kinase [Aggregatilinea lenta]|uniref:adenylate kinase n=1 Tax=Aggregatilinea lenta TaxID=913108 RepID=UPI000E5BE68E|nr:adenylate kinase [Aggregatilinea lenta]